MDLSGDYGVSVIFNVYDHPLFDVGDDLRSNPFEESIDEKLYTTCPAPKYQTVHIFLVSLPP